MKPYIHLTPVKPKGPPLTAELGDGNATPTADGGWTVVSRPNRTGMVEYDGDSPVTMDIPILLDGFATDSSVEGRIEQLYHMMRHRVAPNDEPVVFKITGVPIPFKGCEWVINGITPGTEERRHSDGFRTRAAMTLSVLQYVNGDIITTNPSPAKNKGGHKTNQHKVMTYVVKKGDTLTKIAAKFLGSAKKWHEIANLNNIRSNTGIKPGQKIKIER